MGMLDNGTTQPPSRMDEFMVKHEVALLMTGFLIFLAVVLYFNILPIPPAVIPVIIIFAYLGFKRNKERDDAAMEEAERDSYLG